MQCVEYYWTTKDNVKIFGQEWKPDGKVKGSLALVHGLGEHSGRYKHVAEALAAKGYSLTSFDMRGHGKSEGIRGHSPTYSALMEDITQNISLVKEHFPNTPVFLYGHSLGGILSLSYCLTQKSDIKGAIVTGPAFETGDPVPPLKIALGRLMYNLAPSLQMENGLDQSALSRDLEVVNIYATDPLVHSKISTRWAMDLLDNGKYLIAHAGEFPLPLLLMQGTADRIVNPKLTKEFAQKVPLSKITYEEWVGFYHELHNEPEKSKVFSFTTNWLDLELQ